MRCWALIPAAGKGARMASAVPKQYLPLGGRPVIQYSLERLGRHPLIQGVVVVLAPGDGHWPRLELDLPVPLYTVTGGQERCHSVARGLGFLADLASPDDWVLVHDAARPCLSREDLDRLIRAVGGDPVGGLLAAPVADTLKRGEGGCAVGTLERRGVWRALTPQMFRLGRLRKALEQALERGVEVTDEASAMEMAGYRPRLVEGRGDNIKITRPEDLELAACILGCA